LCWLWASRSWCGRNRANHADVDAGSGEAAKFGSFAILEGNNDIGTTESKAFTQLVEAYPPGFGKALCEHAPVTVLKAVVRERNFARVGRHPLKGGRHESIVHHSDIIFGLSSKLADDIEQFDPAPVVHVDVEAIPIPVHRFRRDRNLHHQFMVTPQG